MQEDTQGLTLSLTPTTHSLGAELLNRRCSRKGDFVTDEMPAAQQASTRLHILLKILLSGRVLTREIL
jgi:hypothetical protein